MRKLITLCFVMLSYISASESVYKTYEDAIIDRFNGQVEKHISEETKRRVEVLIDFYISQVEKTGELSPERRAAFNYFVDEIYALKD